MGRMKFLQWAAAQGWKHGQRYLQKAYNHFYDKGKLPDPKVILQKAKGFYDNFTGFKSTTVPKQFNKFKPEIVSKKPNPLGDILQGKPYIDKQGRSWGFEKVPTPKGLKKSNVIPFPKKPPGKADGGRIDKALPKKSRDI
jgi:hypothetical protein